MQNEAFPFLFGGTFIEGEYSEEIIHLMSEYFPSFSEGLSLRHTPARFHRRPPRYFPSFWEGLSLRPDESAHRLTMGRAFPFLFGRAFIEAQG